MVERNRHDGWTQLFKFTKAGAVTENEKNLADLLNTFVEKGVEGGWGFSFANLREFASAIRKAGVIPGDWANDLPSDTQQPLLLGVETRTHNEDLSTSLLQGVDWKHLQISIDKGESSTSTACVVEVNRYQKNASPPSNLAPDSELDPVEDNGIFEARAIKGT